jgi:hypothetical protein
VEERGTGKGGKAEIKKKSQGGKNRKKNPEQQRSNL